MRSWRLLCDCGKTSAWRVADASGTPFVRSRESSRPQGFLRARGGGLPCESGANPRPRPRSLAFRPSALRSRSCNLRLTCPAPGPGFGPPSRPAQAAGRSGQPRPASEGGVSWRVLTEICLRSGPMRESRRRGSEPTRGYSESEVRRRPNPSASKVDFRQNPPESPRRAPPTGSKGRQPSHGGRAFRRREVEHLAIDRFA